MPFSLPNPTSPTNGQLGDATPILANELAIAQAIAAFDGSQINSKSVAEAALADVINPRLRGSETLANFVYSGCIWSQVSGLNGTMTGGTIYVNGYRVIVTGVGSNTFAASSDTYIDIDYLGNVYYLAVSNNVTAPSLTANAIRIAKLVTNSSAITTISQAQTADNIGNIIYPVGSDSTAKLQIPSKFSVYRNAAFNSAVTPSLITFDTKIFDTGSNYSTSTGKFTAPVSGFYWFSAAAGVASSVTAAQFAYLYVNSVAVKQASGANVATSAAIISTTVNGLLQLNANDYVQVLFTGSNGNAMGVGAEFCWFDGFLASVT